MKLISAVYASLIPVLNRSFVPGVNKECCEKSMERCAESHRKQTPGRNSERNVGLRGVDHTDTPGMTAHRLVNELVSVLYTCHSDVQLYRPTSVVEMVAITIDMIRTNHSSTESFLKMLLNIGYLKEQGIY